MRFLLEPLGLTTLSSIVDAGDAALDGGFDGILISASPEVPSPLVAAAAAGRVHPDLLIAADIVLGDRHPLEVAEEAAVVDQGIAGRLILVVRPARGFEAHYEEAVDLVRTAWAPRPFSWAGPHWPTPANLAENIHNTDRRVRVTPPPLQPRLTMWLADRTPALAIPRGLGHIADEHAELDALARQWKRAERSPFAFDCPRVRRVSVAPWEELVAELLAGRGAFNQDWAVVQGLAADAQIVGKQVRPRVQLDALPTGMQSLWSGGEPTT